MTCPIARSLEHVGEWWSMLILRDAFAGTTRFDEFQHSLGIAPNMLTRRLAALVEAGLLERRRWRRPPRDEYVLTERGRDFKPVLIALVAFGKKHFAAPGHAVLARLRQCLLGGDRARPSSSAAPSREGGATANEHARRRAGGPSARPQPSPPPAQPAPATMSPRTRRHPAAGRN